jgi:predicted dehydrogenase
MDRPQEEEPVPETLDWNLWLGPAAKRPYNHVYLPFAWRGWYDFGTGALGDMACHTLNMPFWGLKLGYPTSVAAQVGESLKPEAYPDWSIIHYEFPAREGLPPLTMTWYDGRKKSAADRETDQATAKAKAGRLKGGGSGAPNRPPRELFGFEGDEQVSGSGVLIIGEKGKLYSPGDNGGNWQFLPKGLAEDAKKIGETIPRSPGHFQEWVDACKGGQPAMSNFNYAGKLTEVVVLGCVAQRLPGRKIEWDGPNMKAVNCPEAEKLIRPEIPKAWWV